MICINEFIGIISNTFLSKGLKLKGVKVKFHLEPSNSLPFGRKSLSSQNLVNQILGKLEVLSIYCHLIFFTSQLFNAHLIDTYSEFIGNQFKIGQWPLEILYFSFYRRFLLKIFLFIYFKYVYIVAPTKESFLFHPWAHVII